MHELRKHYLLDEWVIIASGREKRPKQIVSETKIMPKNKCPFCVGKENETPPEIMRVPFQGKTWRVRVVPNKFSAVDDTTLVEKLELPFRFLRTAAGKHEVIIETPLHELQIADFTESRIMEVLKVWIKRVSALEKNVNVQEVSLFKNQGAKAGASLSHAHSQLIALNQVSERTKNEMSAFAKAFESIGNCPYCAVIALEKDSQRRVFENQSFVAFTPFASKSPFELVIFPKRHSKHFKGMMEKEKADFANVLKKAFIAVRGLGEDFNLYFKHAPPDAGDFHWYVTIEPMMAIRAGFEKATGTMINSFSPEFAASYYREKFEVDK